jgi:signal transduction histidine kinase
MLTRRRAVAALLNLAAAAIAMTACAADRPWRIVVLNGTDPYLPAFVAIDRATRAALTAPGTHPAEIFSETLDMTRFPGGELEPEMLALLRRKYAERQIDAVIAVTPVALDFAQRHRDSLWPDAWIVFHSVSEEDLRERTLLPMTTGVPFRRDVAGAADLALKLWPAARRMIVIGGSSAFDKAVTAAAREQLRPLAQRVEVEFWVEQRFEDLVLRIAQLPKSAVVVQLSIYRDASGRTFVPREAAAQLATASTVPMFSLFESFIGNGVAAGSFDDFDRRGRKTAELVQAALTAHASSAPPLAAVVPSICIADARALRRWNISEGSLPSGCALQFADPSAWQRYRWQILAGLAIILSQSVLIAALILQRRHRRRAEVDTQAARTELAHAARLASMGELTASIAHEIRQPLSAILAHADTAELLLEADTPPLAEIQRIVEEIRRDDLRASDVITRLRDLLGKHAMEHRPMDLNEAIGDALHVVDAEARRRGVTIGTELASGLPPIIGDRVHLQQVVLNLVLNGMDAVAAVEESERRIAVGTATLWNGVQITVADNGAGIDPAIAPRLFESFATTKARGLGLGLSIARSIVEAHGGTIAAEAAVGRGTVFRVVLPGRRGDVGGDGMPAESASSGTSSP